MITFSVPGVPVAKGRPRLSVRNGMARAFTPAKTVAYEGLVAHAGAEAMRGRSPLDGPLSLNVIATFPIPKSWPKKRQAAAVHHTGRPDADNILKAIGDGLNQVVWADDSQLAACRSRSATAPCPASRSPSRHWRARFCEPPIRPSADR